MKIEHIAVVVRDPVGMAEWYVENLGFRVLRKAGEPTHARFIADEAGRVVLEVYNNPKVDVPDYASMDPLVLHVAFSADDVGGARRRLLSAGASPEGDLTVTEAGDELAMLRDPWGLPVQLVKRREPIA